MSRSTSRRVQVGRDWNAHLEAAAAEDAAARSHYPHSPWRDLALAIDYVHAMQAAIEKRDVKQLLAMLDAAVPMPDSLLPVLADVLRDRLHGRSTGRPVALTASQDAVIRGYFDALYPHGQAAGRTKEQTMQELANSFAVSVDTIKRSLNRTAPGK